MPFGNGKDRAEGITLLEDGRSVLVVYDTPAGKRKTGITVSGPTSLTSVSNRLCDSITSRRTLGVVEGDDADEGGEEGRCKQSCAGERQ
ncbi:Protein of unknown function [Arthrobacter sp. OV608]|nr:Protein of unknown function [Arthrobacter sp. OV608]